ncbi:restriction endonuclease subunit S [Halomonas campaniensis]|uniref:restriction endonuclease subunit S n=1 Tax=Halomonas campaniensis TaxID=213554 RepID=UPI0035640D22
MASESQRQTLGDYFTLQRGTTYKSRLLGEPGPVLLGLATIQRNGGFRTDSLKTYGGDSPDKLLVQPGELYLSLKDVTQSADLLGAVARLPSDHPPGRLTQDTVKLKPIGTDVPLDYLYWLLRTPQYRSYCRAHATGTTNLGLAREDFLAFPAPEPTQAQRRIVDTLSALDDKLELNRQMNHTLEAMARAIFKAWFVDFEPVKAKVAGAKSFRGMPQAVFDQLPDRFTDSELGPVPEGWSCVSIGDWVHVVGGATPSTKEDAYWRDGIHPFCTPKDMSRLESPVLLDTQRHITDHGLKKISSGQLPAGTVLLSSRAPIGYLAISETSVSVNQGIIAMQCESVSNLYILFWVEENMDTIKAHAGGSTFAEISKRNFRPLPAVRPTMDALFAFDSLVRPFYERVVSNLRESAVLAQVRDGLLPELLSGNVKV